MGSKRACPTLQRDTAASRREGGSHVGWQEGVGVGVWNEVQVHRALPMREERHGFCVGNVFLRA